MGLDFLNAGTQLVSQFGGMALQNSYNKKAERRQDKYNRGTMDYQLARQPQMLQQQNKANMNMWERTNYPAQRKQMEKAGLNVGLMYGMGGAGGATTGNAGGMPTAGSVQTYAPDAQGAVGNAGMALMNAAQIKLLEAQARNLDADTNKTSGVDTEGVTLDNRLKAVQAEISEATTLEQLQIVENKWVQAMQETNMNAINLGTLDATQKEKIEQERLQTVMMGVEIANKKAQTQLTEAETKEVAIKIDKMVTEIQNMQNLTAIQMQDMLSRKMQVEFNTSTPAQIKQWTDIGVDILKATKGGGNKTTTINQNKNYDNSTTNYE